MTIRRGFNRLFIALFVCWTLANFWLVFKHALESVASANEAAEEVQQVRQNCISSQEMCASTRRARDTAAAKHHASQDISNEGGGDAKPGQGSERKLDTPEQFQQASKGHEVRLEDLDPPECNWFSGINCEALYAVGSKPSIWRECKSHLADTKTILYIEGIPATVYILCWAVAATFLWIARWFGLGAGKKRG